MVTVRAYRAEDQDTIVRLWWESWHSIRAGLRHPQSFSEWRTRWASDIAPAQEIVVAEDRGDIVGFAAADLSARELTQIFVAPGRKRQGIGHRLLAWAQQVTPDGFRLHTLTDNVVSQAFYERLGLVAGEETINPINGMSTREYRWMPSTEGR